MSHRHRHSDYHPHHRRHSSDRRRRSSDRHDRRHSGEYDRRYSNPPVRRSFGSHDRRSWDAADPNRRSFRRSFDSGAEPTEFYDAPPGQVYRETEESQRRRMAFGEDNFPLRTFIQEGGYPRRDSLGRGAPIGLQVPLLQGAPTNSGRQSINQHPPPQPPDQQVTATTTQPVVEKPCPPCSVDEGVRNTAPPPECPQPEEMNQGAQVLTVKFWDKNGGGNAEEEQFLAVNPDMLPKTEIQNLLPMENGKIVMKPRGKRKTVRPVSSGEASPRSPNFEQPPPSPIYSPFPRQQEAFAGILFTPPPTPYNEYQSYREPPLPIQPMYQPPPQHVRMEQCPPQPDVCNNFPNNQPSDFTTEPPYQYNPFLPPPPQFIPPSYPLQSSNPYQQASIEEQYFENDQQDFYMHAYPPPPVQQLQEAPEGRYQEIVYHETRERNDEYDEDDRGGYREHDFNERQRDQPSLESVNGNRHQRDNSGPPEQRRRGQQEEDSRSVSLSYLPQEQTVLSSSQDRFMDPRHPPQPQPFPPYYPPPQRPWTGQTVPPPEYQAPQEPAQRPATAPPQLWGHGQMSPPTQLPFQQMPPSHWQAGNQTCPPPNYPQQDHFNPSSQYPKVQGQQPGAWSPPHSEQLGYRNPPTLPTQRDDGRHRNQGADTCCRDAYNNDPRDPYWNERIPTPNNLSNDLVNRNNYHAESGGRQARRGLGLDNDVYSGNSGYRPVSPRHENTRHIPTCEGVRSNNQGRGRFRDSTDGYDENDEEEDSSKFILRINATNGRGGARNKNFDSRGGRRTSYDDDCGSGPLTRTGRTREINSRGHGMEEDEEDHEPCDDGKRRKKPAIVLEIDPEVMKKINCQPPTKPRPRSTNSEPPGPDAFEDRCRGGSNTRGRGNIRGEINENRGPGRQPDCEDPSKLVLIVNPVLPDNNRNPHCDVEYRAGVLPLSNQDPDKPHESRNREPNRNRGRVQNRCDADDNGNLSMSVYQRNDLGRYARPQDTRQRDCDPRSGNPPIRIQVHSRFYDRLQKDEDDDCNMNDAHRDQREYAMVPKSQVTRNIEREPHSYDESSHDDDKDDDHPPQALALPPPERRPSVLENPRVRFENLDPNLCPYCGIGVFVRKTSMTGYLTAILCFPCGLYCCLAKKCCYITECTYCHATREREPKKKSNWNWGSKSSNSSSDCDNNFNDKKYKFNKDRNKDRFR